MTEPGVAPAGLMGLRSLPVAPLLSGSCVPLAVASSDYSLRLDDALAGRGSDRCLQQDLGETLVRHDAIAAGQDRLGQLQEPHGHELHRPELAAVAANQGRAHDGQRPEPDASKRVFDLAFDTVVEEARARIGPRCRVQSEGACAMPPGKLRHSQRVAMVNPAEGGL